MREHPVPAHRRPHRYALGSGADLLQLPYRLHRDSPVSGHEATTLTVALARSPAGGAILPPAVRSREMAGGVPPREVGSVCFELTSSA